MQGNPMSEENTQGLALVRAAICNQTNDVDEALRTCNNVAQLVYEAMFLLPYRTNPKAAWLHEQLEKLLEDYDDVNQTLLKPPSTFKAGDQLFCISKFADRNHKEQGYAVYPGETYTADQDSFYDPANEELVFLTFNGDHEPESCYPVRFFEKL